VAIYAVLIVGAVGMLYPFLLMLAGATKSAVDMAQSSVLPAFLHDEDALYRKHVEAVCNESLAMYQMVFDGEATGFDTVKPPSETNALYVKEWQRFLEQQDPPFYSFNVGHLRAPVSLGVFPYALRDFKREMVRRYGGSIDRMNSELETEFANWNAFYVLPDNYLRSQTKVGTNAFDLAYREFAVRQPLGNRTYLSVEGFFRYYLRAQYARDIRKYNAAHATAYSSWHALHLSPRRPPGKAGGEWEYFVRNLLSPLWLRVDAAAVPAYRRFLAAKYENIQTLNTRYATTYASFDDVPLVEEPPFAGMVRTDWQSFLQGWKDPDSAIVHIAPADALRIHSVEFAYRDYLRETYGSLDALNAALGTRAVTWLDVLPPREAFHRLEFLARRRALRHEFLTRNFLSVIDYIVLHGRGIVNTAIYCFLAVLFALIVNPLAAYALSRFRPPSTYKILLFLMLTMAFPPMVTQIPAFLLLRDLRLLNTFAALILPGVANGYSIFLLKGFFDSLPRELYESAQLDGAGEFRIFWGITMNLSKPVLAVIALNAFNIAYSNFMMALLICQDERMWTLMPWLYQLQNRAGQGVVYASLIIAAIPTFAVFLFAQNVIMRGIVVPVEK